MTTEIEKAALLVNLLHDEGYKGKPFVRDEIAFVESGSSGYKFIFSFASEGTVQMYCGVKLMDGVHIPLDSVNEFNKQFRFAKLYLDDDGDLNSQADFYFDPSLPGAAEIVRQMTGLMDVTVSEMRTILQANMPDPDVTIVD